METEHLQSKQSELANLKIYLKSKFFGLDQVIDDVVKGMASWYIFPDNQKRPLVINLWGMTGVGKSDLVRQIVNFLHLESRFFQFDLGELGHGSMGNPRTILSETYQFKGSEPRVILLDEFQLGRTLNHNGVELPHKELRVIWQLLDNGRIQFIEPMIAGRRTLNSILHKFDYWVSQGMTIENGMVDAKYFAYFEDDDSEDEEETEANQTARFIFEKKRLKTILEMNSGRFQNIHELRLHIQKLNTLQIRNLLKESLASTLKPIEQDFSKSLIFVVGNLDEAFAYSKDQSPDISPDKYYELTSEITLPEIKEALLRRFRPEQISRLGNNHVIYPSLPESAYRAIIRSELHLLKEEYESKSGQELQFHPSVAEWIFQEGVVPTQGVRPLKSTIKYGIEDLMSYILLEKAASAQDSERLEIRISQSLQAVFYKGEVEVHRKTFALTEKVKPLKNPRKDDLQAVVAVHESGHAIVSMALFGKVPERVNSIAAGANQGGFILLSPSKLKSPKLLLNEVAVELAGFLAERAVFGLDRVSNGSEGDLEKATNQTMTYFKRNGFADSLIYHATYQEDYDNYYHSITDIEEEAAKFMKDARRIAEKILARELTLLLEMSMYLADHASLDQHELMEMAKKFGSLDLILELEKEEQGYRDLLLAKAMDPFHIVKF